MGTSNLFEPLLLWGIPIAVLNYLYAVLPFYFTIVFYYSLLLYQVFCTFTYSSLLQFMSLSDDSACFLRFLYTDELLIKLIFFSSVLSFYHTLYTGYFIVKYTLYNELSLLHINFFQFRISFKWPFLHLVYFIINYLFFIVEL